MTRRVGSISTCRRATAPMSRRSVRQFANQTTFRRSLVVIVSVSERIVFSTVIQPSFRVVLYTSEDESITLRVSEDDSPAASTPTDSVAFQTGSPSVPFPTYMRSATVTFDADLAARL